MGAVTTHDTPVSPPRRIAVLIAVAVVVIALDQITKYLVVAHLEGKPTDTVIPGVLYLDVFRNSGAAFSMATGLTWVLSVVAIAVVIGIVWVAPRLRSVGWAIGLGLVLAGALGNLTDRLFRAPGPLRGHVVDFISLFRPLGEGFAIFNLADSAITCGGVLIVLLALLGKDYDGGVARRTKQTETEPEPATEHGTDAPTETDAPTATAPTATAPTATAPTATAPAASSTGESPGESADEQGSGS
jgi:signal peptidase II